MPTITPIAAGCGRDCEYWTGFACYQCREYAYAESIKVEVNTWAWNLSPTECALEAIRLDYTPREVETAMIAVGFSEGITEDVTAAIEVLS